MLIFDGLDEFPLELQKSSLVVKMIEGSYLPKAKILVTSRPSTQPVLNLLSQAASRKEIEVVGFSQKDIERCADSHSRM